MIEAYRGEYAVSTMCQALEVSVSGYYAWRNRPLSQRQQTDQELVERIRQVHQDNRCLYGSPRIHVVLRQSGIPCSRKRVARLMHQHEIHSIRRL